MEQETLEEVAERILANNIDGLRDALQDDDLFFFYKGVIQCYGEAMVEWQQEQDKNKYSDEEVLEQLNHLIMMPSSKLDEFTNDEEMVTMKWFEQFKKK
jgi:hypothetical protein